MKPLISRSIFKMAGTWNSIVHVGFPSLVLMFALLVMIFRWLTD